MKRIFLTLTALIILGSFSANAQKVGYCEIEKIISIMPEYEQAKAKLEGEMQEIQNQAEEMQVEFNNKYKEYTDNLALDDNDPKKWSPAIQQVKEQELQQLQQRIQDFQLTAQQSFQDRQLELIQPITDKVDSVLDVIMAEDGYLYIIKDLSIIQVNKKKVDDVGPKVKQKLGLQ